MENEKRTKCENCKWIRYFGDISVHYCGQCFEVVEKEDYCILDECNWRDTNG